MAEDISSQAPAIDPRLMDIIECPRCHSALQLAAARLSCKLGHEYPVVNGVPVFLLSEKDQTIDIARTSYEAAQSNKYDTLYIDTLGLSEHEKIGIKKRYAEIREDDRIDPVISYLIGATSGFGYVNLIGNLTEYPIPQIPISHGTGKLLLDLGCNWGRWSISAARKGWCVVGIDPSLGAIMAARRAFKNERNVMFICGDARFLPFRDNIFGSAFSYSVIQHFSEADADVALAEIGRVLDQSGVSMIQMAHRGGMRSTYIRLRRDYMNGGAFRVRYWSIPQIIKIFTRNIGRTEINAEAFGGLGLLGEDIKIVSVKAKMLIVISIIMKNIARVVKPLVHVADSVYVISVKR